MRAREKKLDSAVGRARIASPETSTKRCPECGASNKQSAQWCGQCLTKFVAAAPPPPPPPVSDAGVADRFDGVAPDPGPAEREAAGAAIGEQTGYTRTGEAGAVRVDEDGISWTCVRCETVNAFDANFCEVCGAKFADSIRPPEEPRPARDPNKVALISLFMPGAGHAYLGMWGEAIARAVVSIWVVLVSLFAAAQNVSQARIMAILFAVVATGLWMVAAHDAHREAAGLSTAVILKRRFFLYLVLGLLLLSIVMIFSMVLGAR